jgi:ribulose-5-phosphate 4-epimerase/fuculose-1-phosphate aldolase
LSHHGMIATGPTLSAALALAIEVETLAEMYWRALQVGEPALLSDGEMQRVLKLFVAYGNSQSTPSHEPPYRTSPATRRNSS